VEDRLELKRDLGLFDATMIVIGNVVGMGIFITTGLLAQELPHPLYIIAIWIIGGFLTLAGALTYSELASALPHAGGDYNYLKAAYGPWAGFLLGWISFFVINPGSIAALSVGAVKYLSFYFPIFKEIIQEKLMAISMVLLLSTINYLGVKAGSKTQNFLTMVKLLTIIGLIALGFTIGKGSWHHFTVFSTRDFKVTNLLGTAMIAVIFTYSGWFASAYMGSEIKNPKTNLPLSFIIGTLVAMILYCTLNSIYIYALPVEEMTGVVNIGEKAASVLFGPVPATLISLLICLAILGTLNSTILTAPRMYYAMAKDGLFVGMMTRVHPKYRTPHVSISLQAALSCVLIVLGTFNQLLTYVVFAILLSSIASGIALFTLRLRRPDLRPDYRTWGYPYTPVIFILAYIWIAIQILFGKPLESLIGIGIVLTGIPFYIYWKRHTLSL